MDRDKVASISAALTNIAGIFAERVRQEHPTIGARPPFEFFHAALIREGEKLRLDGQPKLADAFLALRKQIGDMDNA